MYKYIINGQDVNRKRVRRTIKSDHFLTFDDVLDIGFKDNKIYYITSVNYFNSVTNKWDLIKNR